MTGTNYAFTLMHNGIQLDAFNDELEAHFAAIDMLADWNNDGLDAECIDVIDHEGGKRIIYTSKEVRDCIGSL